MQEYDYYVCMCPMKTYVPVYKIIPRCEQRNNPFANHSSEPASGYLVSKSQMRGLNLPAVVIRLNDRTGESGIGRKQIFYVW